MIKNKSWHICTWMILCMVILFMVMPASVTAQAQEAGGYWQLISVDVEEKLPVDQATSQEIAENKNAWVLVETLDFENADRWATADAHPSYAISHGYSRGVYTASATYEGVDTYGQGLSGTLGLQAVYTGVPEIIYPDQPVSLNFSFTVTENTVVKLSFGGFAGADFDQWDLGPGGVTRGSKPFANKDGINSFNLSNASDSPLSYNETLTAMLGPGEEGDRIALRTKTAMFGLPMGTNYVYEWKQVGESAVVPTVPEPDWEPSPPTTVPGAEGLISRVIVVVGIAIAGTMSAIAANLANKAAQAAASEKDEQPTEEIVYVLNPSHKGFNLEVDRPVTLTVNGYRVTQGGYQTEPDAQISIDLPPEMAEYIQLQGTSSPGQVSCIITLLKIPSAATVPLDIQGVFPHGKASAQVQLAFKMEFAIYPVRSPNITYYEKDQQWQAPELVACFRDPVQETPLRVGFYYGFTDPPLTFKPNILEVKEGYSSDDGLTYNFKLNVRDGINLETHFGKDLTKYDGRVTVEVVVKDEQGKEYTAETALELHPQLKLISYAYDPDIGFSKRGRPKTAEGIELDDMEFIADGNDILPVVFFFVRTDKEFAEGQEYLSALDLVDVESVEFVTGTLPAPEKNEADCNKGLFAYRVRSDRAILYSEKQKGNHILEVEARIKASAPKNIGLASKPLHIKVSPQFLKFDFWVVPGQYRDTSEAFAFVQLYPRKIGVPNMDLSLEIENPSNTNRGFLKLVNEDREQTTRDKDYFLSAKYVPLMQGSACWALEYSNMSWDNLSSCIFQVTCYGPESDTGPIWQTSRTIDVGQNISSLLNDLVDQSGKLDLNNPYWKDSMCPVHLRGPVWNFVCKFDYSKPYVCKWLREIILGWLTARSFYGDGNDPKQIEIMMSMNGIEYQYCCFPLLHYWANLFLSGTHPIKAAKALDPWWEQRWTDPSSKDHKNLITVYSELNWKLSQRGLAHRAIAEIQAGVLFFAGIVSVLSMLCPFTLPITIPGAVSMIMAAYFSGSPAHAIVAAGATVDHDNYHPDKRKRLFLENWFVKFIQALSKSDD